MTLRATKQPIDTRSAAGKAFLDMLGVFAEFETTLRRERQLAGTAAAKARGGLPRSQARSRPHRNTAAVRGGRPRGLSHCAAAGHRARLGVPGTRSPRGAAGVWGPLPEGRAATAFHYRYVGPWRTADTAGTWQCHASGRGVVYSAQRTHTPGGQRAGPTERSGLCP